jgi:DNA-binding XRE family transcriptional regulator
MFPKQSYREKIGSVTARSDFHYGNRFSALTYCLVKTNELIKTGKKRTNEGAAIRRLRTEAGISQEHLARRVGVTTHTIWRLENDPSANPRLETLRSIARALSVPLSQVIGD